MYKTLGFLMLSGLSALHLSAQKDYTAEEQAFLQKKGNEDNKYTYYIAFSNKESQFTPFYLYINDEKVNPTPCTCVEIRNAPMDTYKATFDMQDGTKWINAKYGLTLRAGEVGGSSYYAIERTKDMDGNPAYKGYSDMILRAKTVYLPSPEFRCVVDRANKDNNYFPAPLLAPSSTPTNTPTVVEKPRTTSSGVGPGCGPISDNNLEELLDELNSTMNTITRREKAQTFVQKNCMSSEQIKAITEILGNSIGQKDFAKFAYPFCSDPSNYKEVINVLSSSLSRKEVEAATINAK